MKSKNPKLLFIQSIAQQARRMEHEISLEAKSVVKNLQQRPKSYYTLQDVEDVIEGLKTKMLSLNKETHTEFSKKGIKSLTNLADTEIEKISLEMLASGEEVKNILEELETVREELKVVSKERDELQAKEADIQPLRLEIENLRMLLGKRDEEIAQLKSQSGVFSGKVEDQMQELNRLQEQLDESQRDLKQARKEREKIEAEFETVGNTLMTTRLEIEELQTALANKDIEIENLKAENKVLVSHTEENVHLKDENQKLGERLDQLKTQFQDVSRQKTMYEATVNELKEQISRLEQENEDLLLDSGETSQTAVTLKNQLDNIKSQLNQKESEIREITNRLGGEITALKEELVEKLARTQTVQNKLDEANEAMEELRRKNRALETEVEDIKVDQKGKNLRIDSIESERDKLRNQLADARIENEQQKSEISNLQSQVKARERELNVLQNDLEVIRQRQEEIAKQASDSRGAKAEVERQKDLYEVQLQNLQLQIEDITESKENLERKLEDSAKELVRKNDEIESLMTNQKRLGTRNEKLSAAVETLRINLAKNPKYAILFVLQDIKQASVGELAKTVAIQLVFAVRLVKELESDGWVDFDEDQGIVRLKRPLLEND
ncbi:MAG: hypothetical protein ACFFFG_03945 [Candidatus Thorarchaeota archaeon]